MGVEFTQHPELFAAVDIEVPLLDMLRFEKIAAGASWVGEYGSVAQPDERAFLASISPYNNLRAGVAYPEPFIWTTTKDDRVGPAHARKFAAKLASLGDSYLFYEVLEGGHGSGVNIEERAFTTALEYTYFTRRLMLAARPEHVPNSGRRSRRVREHSARHQPGKARSIQEKFVLVGQHQRLARYVIFILGRVPSGRETLSKSLHRSGANS